MRARTVYGDPLIIIYAVSSRGMSVVLIGGGCVVRIPPGAPMKSLKLSIELIPKTCWYSNVRSIVSKKQWDALRKIVATEANNVCEICGGKGKKHPVECHEIWSYDDNSMVQKLTGLIALCPDCHSSKHFGLAEILGRRDFVIKHLMKINGITKTAIEKHIQDSFFEFSERSKKQWTLDVSLLEKYGINIEDLDL